MISPRNERGLDKSSITGSRGQKWGSDNRICYLLSMSARGENVEVETIQEGKKWLWQKAARGMFGQRGGHEFGEISHVYGAFLLF